MNILSVTVVLLAVVGLLWLIQNMQIKIEHIYQKHILGEKKRPTILEIELRKQKELHAFTTKALQEENSRLLQQNQMQGEKLDALYSSVISNLIKHNE